MFYFAGTARTHKHFEKCVNVLSPFLETGAVKEKKKETCTVNHVQLHTWCHVIFISVLFEEVCKSHQAWKKTRESKREMAVKKV